MANRNARRGNLILSSLPWLFYWGINLDSPRAKTLSSSPGGRTGRRRGSIQPGFEVRQGLWCAGG